jgi:predicted dehydrogenase
MGLADASRELVGRCMISVLLSGYGKWGRILARNLLEHPDFFLEAVHDPASDARRDARCANLHTYHTFSDALDHTNAQLVIFASPIGSQVDSAILALNRYRDVMMAKPGPRTINEAQRVYQAADARRRHVVVDYTMMMAERYRELQEITSSVWMFDAVRRAEGRRSSESIIDDLVVHDVAMLVGLDPMVRVYSAEVTEDSARIEMVNHAGVIACTITAEYNADNAERRIVVNGEKWNQLRKERGRGPVWERLTSMRNVVRGWESDNRSVVRETTRVLEEIKRCAT